MTIRLLDLSTRQKLTLDRLSAGYRASEAVGCELGELTDAQLIVCQQLAALRLVETRAGWRRTTWFSLTLRGWTLRAQGWAP